MPEHNAHKPPQNSWSVGTKPVPREACAHNMDGWFCLPLTPSQSWLGSRDVPDDDDEFWSQNNGLLNMCNSFSQVTNMRWQNGNTTQIYDCMMARPDMCMEWHNAASSGYYVRLGCVNCGSCTPKYQPQLEMPWFNQETKRVKGHPAIKHAFRAFVSQVLNDQALEAGEPPQ